MNILLPLSFLNLLIVCMQSIIKGNNGFREVLLDPTNITLPPCLPTAAPGL